MNQRIIGFDELACQVVVHVDGVSPYAVDLPINEDGSTLEGEELLRYLRGFYPSQYFERKERLKNGVKNAQAVRALVNPFPESAPSNAEVAVRVRLQRNELLSASDWTQVTDAPLSAEQVAAFAAYRQELREIPNQAGFPFDVVWPMNPSEEPR